MKYNLSKIMLKAWEIYRKYNIKFSEALHRAWLSAKAEEVNCQPGDLLEYIPDTEAKERDTE